jgi:hypothetical protein
VREPTVEDLPGGYVYGVTRYAHVILRHAFPQRFADEQDLARVQLTSLS